MTPEGNSGHAVTRNLIFPLCCAPGNFFSPKLFGSETYSDRPRKKRCLSHFSKPTEVSSPEAEAPAQGARSETSGNETLIQNPIMGDVMDANHFMVGQPSGNPVFR